MQLEVKRVIAAEHPSLAGHFPGEPIVPGVVILAEVAAILAHWRRDRHLTGISAVKFLTPLKPEQRFVIRLNEVTDSDVSFVCEVDGRAIAQGRLTCDAI